MTKFSLIQLNTGCDPKKSFEVLKKFIVKAASGGSKFICTPETTNIMEVRNSLLFKKIYSEKELRKHYNKWVYQDRKVLRKKFKNDKMGYKAAKNKARVDTGQKFWRNLEIAISAIDRKTSIPFLNLLDRVGLANKSHIKVANLSIGEKQRLAVARAFVGDPKWVFCDEPTSSLDDKNANIIANLIKEESMRCKASLVLITHDSRIQSLINFSQILRLGEKL